MGGLELVITITDRSRGEKFVSRYQACGIPMVIGALGRGTATGAVLDYLGLEATPKAVLFCLVTGAQAHRFVRDTAKALWLDIPGNGIVLTVPLSSIGSRATLQYLTEEQPMEAKEGASRQACDTHELIIVITNQGNTDPVMDAARAAGAAGGTMVHAKGTGVELARKFFGVSLAAEKEMLFIVARKEARNAIMKAVMEEAGMQTPAQSIAFSLPVCEIAGLRVFEVQSED